MTRFILTALALAALSACAPAPIPDSGAGVGFDRVDADRAARDAALRGEAPAPLPGLEPVSQQPLGDASGTMGPGSAATGEPLQTVASTAASARTPSAVTNTAGISQEQDFDAVSGQRGIDDDAARIAAARAQYQVIEPSALPTRPGTNVPNIVEYALRTNNPVGAQIYNRSGIGSGNRHVRNCAGYASPDLAQEDFLSRGGPQRDRRGLDPDGDGFACEWDPTPFRRAVAPSPAPSPLVTPSE